MSQKTSRDQLCVSHLEAGCSGLAVSMYNDANRSRVGRSECVHANGSVVLFECILVLAGKGELHIGGCCSSELLGLLGERTV